MYFGAIQICGERVGSSECKDFCEALDANKIKMLSLRECGISTKNFKKMMDSIGFCKSILHLNLNLCGIHCQDRVDMLSASLNMNKSLTALLLHGNHFGTEGVIKIVKPLILHPHITCLDVGDCDIGEKGLKYICELLPPDGDKPGLQELVLSGNPRICPRAWEKFSVAISACSTLRSLYIDFNNIGEMAGKMLVVSAAGHRSLSVLDMEACDLSEGVGRLLLHLLQHYPTCLTHVLLEENDICEDTKYAIRLALGESASEDSSLSDLSDDADYEVKQRSSRPKSRQGRKKKTKKCVDCCDETQNDCESSDGEFTVHADITVHKNKNCPSILKDQNNNTDGKSNKVCRNHCKCCSRPKQASQSNQCQEETLAKLKICVEEASDSSDGEVLQEHDDHKAQENRAVNGKPSNAEDQEQSINYNIQQEMIQKDGKDYLHIHGDCRGGTVRVRLRSRSREPVEVECIPASCEPRKSKVSTKCRTKTKRCRIVCDTPCDSPCDEPVEEAQCACESERVPKSRHRSKDLSKSERCRVSNKSRSRSQGAYTRNKTFRHRGSLGLANADIWSDEEDECLSNKQQGKADKCGRGPWCGGGMTKPLKPLERLGNIEKQDDKSLRRGSRKEKRKIPEIAVSRPDNDEKTDNDVSEIKPDSRLPAAEFRRSSVNRNKTPDIIIEKERVEEVIPTPPKRSSREKPVLAEVTKPITKEPKTPKELPEKKKTNSDERQKKEEKLRPKEDRHKDKREGETKPKPEADSGDSGKPKDRDHRERGDKSKDGDRRTRDRDGKSRRRDERSGDRSKSRNRDEKSESDDRKSRDREERPRGRDERSRGRDERRSDERRSDERLSDMDRQYEQYRSQSRNRGLLGSIKRFFVGDDAEEKHVHVRGQDNEGKTLRHRKDTSAARNPRGQIAEVGDAPYHHKKLDLTFMNLPKTADGQVDLYIELPERDIFQQQPPIKTTQPDRDTGPVKTVKDADLPGPAPEEDGMGERQSPPRVRRRARKASALSNVEAGCRRCDSFSIMKVAGGPMTGSYNNETTRTAILVPVCKLSDILEREQVQRDTEEEQLQGAIQEEPGEVEEKEGVVAVLSENYLEVTKSKPAYLKEKSNDNMDQKSSPLKDTLIYETLHTEVKGQQDDILYKMMEKSEKMTAVENISTEEYPRRMSTSIEPQRTLQVEESKSSPLNTSRSLPSQAVTVIGAFVTNSISTLKAGSTNLALSIESHNPMKRRQSRSTEVKDDMKVEDLD